jgi:4-amino-4-deoxy-L-arabinose transferase-like glycosyltransferase
MPHTNYFHVDTPTTPSVAGICATTGMGLIRFLPYLSIMIVFVFAGLIGHDPWKADEAYIFGVVQHMFDSSDWIVPVLAGEPFMEKPPLYYWVATAFAYALSGWLPLHDGARIASGFFMSITCWAAASAARIWWGEGMGRYAILIMMACLGLLVQSHMMMPDIPLLAGFAISACGFAYILSKPVSGGVLLGLGIGIGFLAKGVIAPAVIGTTALMLPLCFKAWRIQTYRHGLLIAAIVCMPWLLIWPVALYLRSPALFIEWFWNNNIGRFVGFSVAELGAKHVPRFWPKTIPWFTFPGLPLALWLLWQKRKTALSEPAIQYSVVAFGVLMLVLAVSASGRCVYALPLIVPIAILAAPGARSLPRQIDKMWGWTSLGLFGALSLVIWTGWVIMMFKGAPPAWPLLLRYLPMDFVPKFDVVHAVTAALLSIGAFFALRKLWHMPARGLTVWVTGITLSWSLLMTLWIPWLDFAKSYRSVFASMPVPAASNCIASQDLGEGERAMLRYVTGHLPVRREVFPDSVCNTLLVQGYAAPGEPTIDLQAWERVWHGARPGITNERFWLYVAKIPAGARTGANRVADSEDQ